MRAGGWQEQWRVDTPTLTGKRLGILGLGNIGSRIAQRAARGFDMEIGYHNQAAVAGSPYRYFASLIELATWADFLVCAAPGARGRGTSSTRTCSPRSDRRAISSTSGAGRSWIPRPDRRAARAAHCGADLDVLEGEPSIPPILPELLQCDNVVVTPHVAGRAGVAHRSDRDDSGQPERAFCGPAAAFTGRK